MSSIIGRQFLIRFKDAIGLTDSEVAALAFFRSDSEGFLASVKALFQKIDGIKLEPGLFQGIFVDPVNVFEMAYQLEFGNQVLDQFKLANSGFAKIIDYMQANFDYEVITPPASFSEAVQSRIAVHDEEDFSFSNFLADLGISFLDGIDNLLLTVPAAIAFSELTFLKASSALTEKFSEFKSATIGDFAADFNLTGKDLEIAQETAKRAGDILKLAQDIMPALWDAVTGSDPDPRNFTGVLKTLNEGFGALTKFSTELEALDGAADVFVKLSSFLETYDEFEKLNSAYDNASPDARTVINVAVLSNIADFVSGLSALLESASDLVPGLKKSQAGKIIDFIDALAEGLAENFKSTNFDILNATRDFSAEIFASSIDVFGELQSFIEAIDNQIGITDGVAEAIETDEDASAPEIITESDIEVDLDEGPVVDIDIVDNGDVRLEIIGGLDSDLFAIVDGQIVFTSDAARNTPDANGDGVYDILVEATNSAGVSSQRAFQIRLRETSEPTEPEQSFVDVEGIDSAETVEGQNLQFVIRLSDAAPRDVTLDYRIDLGSAEISDINFASLTGTLTILAGQSTGILSLPTRTDIDAVGEALSVTLTGASGGAVLGGSLSATGTINDVVGAPDLVVNNISIDRTTIDHDGFAILTINIQNIGSADAPASITALRLNYGVGQEILLGNISANALGVGEVQSLTVRLARGEASSVGVDAAFVIPETVPPGALGFTAFVDAPNTILETTSTNNELSYSGVTLSPPPVTGSPDLVVSSFELVAANVDAGGELVYRWTITNIGDEVASATSHGLFLSDSATVSTDDPRLQLIYTDALAPGQSQSGETRGLLPGATDDGGYNVALIADVRPSGNGGQVDESDESNNVGQTASLLVGDAPNVAVSGLTFSSTDFTPGARITATIEVTNNSQSKSFAGWAQFKLSDDEIIAANDDRLTRITVPELEAGESRTLTVTFFVPETTEPGPYFAGVFIEEVPGDTNPLDNVLLPIQVNVPEPPPSADGRDLTFSAFNWGATTAELGGAPLSVNYTVTNQGDAATFNGGAVKFYASADGVLSDNDVLLNGFSFGVLEAGESRSFDVNVAIRSSVGTGDVNIIAVIEPGPGRTNFGVPEPNDDDLTNNTLVQMVTVTPAGDAPPDGELVPAWANGAPASGSWTYEVFGRYGTRYPIDWDGGIRNGLGEEIRGDGGFGRDAYRWQGFAPEEAYYDQNGRGLVFEGTTNGLDSRREVFVTPEGGEFVRFLDTVTNNTDTAVEFSFFYTLVIDLIRGSNVSFYDGISGNPADFISTAHTFIAGFSSDDNGPLLGPSWSWSVGERGYFVSDTFERWAGGDRFYLETTVTLAPGESASFLHFGDHSSRIDNGSSGNYGYEFSDDEARIEREFDNGRLEGLTPEDLQHVINYDVSHLIKPADLSLNDVDIQVGANGSVTYDLIVANLGSFESNEASLSLEITNTITGAVQIAPLALIVPLGRSGEQTVSGSLELSDYVIDGTYRVALQLAHSNGSDASAVNDQIQVADAVSVQLFTDGADIVSLPRSGSFDLGAGDDRVSGSDGSDSLTAGAGRDVIFGGDGNDTIADGTGPLTSESNYFYGEGGNDTLVGSGGSDLLDGGADSDQLFGAGGRDTLRGGAGLDFLSGGDGNDSLEGGDGADTLRGGAGRDRADYSRSDSGVFVSLETDEAFGGHAEGDFLFEIEDIGGSAFDDVLIGDDGANQLFGRGGNDRFIAGLGADRLDGGSGFDVVDYRTSAEAILVALNGGVGRGGDAEGDQLFDIEGVYGSAFSDIIFGGAGNDQIEANAGDDWVLGGGGSDRLDGGAGIDTLDYFTSTFAVTLNLQTGRGLSGDALGDNIINFENVSGSFGDDFIIGDGADNRLEGRQGSDILLGGLGADILVGGSGNDELDGEGGDDIILGGSGNDTLAGGDGIDTVVFDETGRVVVRLNTQTVDTGDTISGFENATTGSGNDSLIGSSGANVLSSGDGDDYIDGLGGDDIINGGAGADRLFGGDGNDTVVFDEAGRIIVRLNTQTVNTGDTISSFENATTGSGNDVLIGSNIANRLNGRDGDDYLDGLGGDDHLNGGEGADRLVGGSGNDVLIGGAGDDILNGGIGADTLSGGAGNDTVVFDNADRTIVRLNSQTVNTGDSISGIENVITGSGNDAIIGSDTANILTAGAGDDYLDGLGGHDILIGGSGSDRLFGRDGNDTLAGGLGNDTLDGGDGNDTVVFDEASRVVVRLNSQTVNTGDTITGFENATTGSGNDALIGSSVANILTAGAGDDYLDGLAGDDVLNGGAGNDRLIGGAGADLLLGGAGDDMIVLDADDIRLDNGQAINLGGSGRDTLVMADGVAFATNGLSVYGFEEFIGSSGNDRVRGNDGSVDYVLDGGAGDDTLTGNSGNDTLIGGLGADRLFGGAGDDMIVLDADDIRLDNGQAIDLGGSGRDTLVMAEGSTFVTNGLSAYGFEEFIGAGGNDRVRGNDGSVDYVLNGGAGDDTLTGNSGNDTLIGGLGADRLFGGAGDDMIVLDADDIRLDNGQAIDLGGSGRDTLVMAEGVAFVTGGLSLYGFEEFIGSSGNDRVRGNDGSVDYVLDGGAGNDTLTGNNGSDTLIGGLGNDTLDGGAGNDTIVVGPGTDILDGGTGIDTLLFEETSDRIVVRLNNQTVNTGDTIAGFENATTGAGNDALIGSAVANILTSGAGDDYIDALGGDDVLNGGAGNDRLFGRDGNDTLAGGSGNDTLDGGDGNDTVVFDEAGRVVVRLNNQTVSTGDAIANFENATTGAGNDALIGSSVANILTAGAGDDYIDGQAGNDVLIGGTGNDRLVGGVGEDTFVFDTASGGSDQILDYAQGVDHVQIRTMDTAFDTFSEVLAAGTQDGADTVFDFGGGNILRLASTTLSSLTVDDFLFAATASSVSAKPDDLSGEDTFGLNGSYDGFHTIKGDHQPVEEIALNDFDDFDDFATVNRGHLLLPYESEPLMTYRGKDGMLHTFDPEAQQQPDDFAGFEIA